MSVSIPSADEMPGNPSWAWIDSVQRLKVPILASQTTHSSGKGMCPAPSYSTFCPASLCAGSSAPVGATHWETWCLCVHRNKWWLPILRCEITSKKIFDIFTLTDKSFSNLSECKRLFNVRNFYCNLYFLRQVSQSRAWWWLVPVISELETEKQQDLVQVQGHPRPHSSPVWATEIASRKQQQQQ